MAPARRRRSSKSPAARGGATRESPLPHQHANDLIAGGKGKTHSVKTQELKLEDGKSIMIARVKVPTPKGVSGHIIRRFDTDAISASSLYRVAFPTASDLLEADEMKYIRDKYDTRTAGGEYEPGGEGGRLTGTWVPLEDAPSLIKEYDLVKYAAELLEVEPPAGSSADHGTISTPTAPTPARNTRRQSKSPAPPASARSKRSRVASPPVSTSAPSTRSATSTMQSLAGAAEKVSSAVSTPITSAATPSKPTSSRSSGRKSSAAPVSSSKKQQQQQQQQQEQEHEAGGIQVTQEISTDALTGETVEETKVVFTGADAEAITAGADAGLIGTDEQAREAAENARKLIESLKEEGILQNGREKRSRQADEDEDEAADDEVDELAGSAPAKKARGVFGRSKDKQTPRKKAQTELGELQVMQSPDGAQVLVAQTAPPPQQQANRRRYIAMAGMVVVGAATAAAPYFFS